MEPQEREVEEAEFGKVVGRFIQRSGFSAYERLLCSLLINALSASPLETVIYTMRAGMLVDDETMTEMNMNRTEIEGLYAVAQVLNNPAIIRPKRNPHNLNAPPEEERIALFMDTLDWETQIAPWAKMQYYEYWFSAKTATEYLEEYWKEKHGEVNDRVEKFHKACKNLSKSGFEHIKDDFLIYAMPKVQGYTRKLSMLVSPETYLELLKVFTSKPRGVDEK